VVSLGNPDVAKITGVGFPAFGLTRHDFISDSQVHISAADISRLVESGAHDVVLATLDIEGLEEGTTPVNVQIITMDDDLGVAFRPQIHAGTVVVPNAAPKVIVGSDNTIDEGDSFSDSGAIVDPGDEVWSATVDYGDGSGVQPLAPNGSSFTLSHAYQDAGDFTVRVTVTDDDGAIGSASMTIHVMPTCPTLPGLASPSQDLDGDGLCEDINGNGRLDFDDVIQLFEHITAPEVVNNAEVFDFNHNGRVDMSDIIELFMIVAP